MGVTRVYSATTKKVEDIVEKAFLLEALGTPEITDLVLLHRGWLFRGQGSTITRLYETDVASDLTFDSAGEKKPAQFMSNPADSVDMHEWKVRRMRAATRLFSAKSRLIGMKADQRGTLSEFRLRLDIAPHWSLYYGHMLIRTRKEWVAERQKLGIASGHEKTAADLIIQRERENWREVKTVDKGEGEDEKADDEVTDKVGDGDGDGDGDGEGDGDAGSDADADGSGDIDEEGEEEDDGGSGVDDAIDDNFDDHSPGLSQQKIESAVARIDMYLRLPRPGSDSPVFASKSRFVRLTNSAVDLMFNDISFNGETFRQAIDREDVGPLKVADIFSVPTRKAFVQGNSVMTNGCNVVFLFHRKIPLSIAIPRAAAGSTVAEARTAAKAALRAEAAKQAAVDFGTAHAVVGSDPGGVALSTNVSRVWKPGVGPTFVSWRLTSAFVRNFAAREANRERSLRYLKPLYNKGLHEELSAVPACASSTEESLRFANVQKKWHMPLMKEKLQLTWLNQIRESKRRRMQALAMFWGSTAAGELRNGNLGESIVIAFGNSTFSPCIRGRPPSATTINLAAAITALKSTNGRWGKGVLHRMPEPNTSLDCSACGLMLQLMFAPVGISARERAKVRKRMVVIERGGLPNSGSTSAWRECRGQRRCVNPACPAADCRIKDRDVNAGVSIGGSALALGRGEAQPAFMDRSHYSGPKPEGYHHTI